MLDMTKGVRKKFFPLKMVKNVHYQPVKLYITKKTFYKTITKKIF